MVWGYALGWFLLTDPIKLLAYHILDPAKSAKPIATASPAPGTEAAPLPAGE
jgi:H+-transporting ATPase